MDLLAYRPRTAQPGSALFALASPLETGGLTGPLAGTRTRWFHVAPYGAWEGHSEGAFELTREHFESVVRILKSKRTPCSVDYEHASIRPSGGPTPAAGFVLDAEIRDDGLWCLVECTETSDRHIRAGEYRFSSGVFDFSARDAVSNEPHLCVLDSIAFTNRPFLDGQTPIACTRVVSPRAVPLTAGAPMAAKITRKDLDGVLDMFKLKEFTPSQLMKALEFVAAMKGGGEDVAAESPAAEPAESADLSKKATTTVTLSAPVVTASEAQLGAAINAAAEVAVAVEAAPAVALAEAPPVDEPVASSSAMDALMQATGLDAAALDAAIMNALDAIVALLSGGGEMAATTALAKDLTLETLKEQVVALSGEVSRFRKSDEQSALDDVAAAASDGRILPAQRANWITLAKSAPAACRTAVAGLPKSSLLRPHATALTAPTPESERLAATVVVDPTGPVADAVQQYLTAGGHKPGSDVWKRAMGAIPRA